MLQWRTATDKNIGDLQIVKANVRALRQILDQAGRRDYTVRVYPKARQQLDGGPARQSERSRPP